EVRCRPTLSRPPQPVALPIGVQQFRGVPSIMERVIFGADSELLELILTSGHWTGTYQELLSLVQGRSLFPHRLSPLRDAIDLVHASVYTTIKMTKFSHSPPICGGAVEIGVIPPDGHFRWVRHQAWDAAIE